MNSVKSLKVIELGHGGTNYHASCPAFKPHGLEAENH